MNKAESDIYIPGSCNIGPEEIKRRFRVGYTGLVLMVLLILCIKWLHLPHTVRLLLFLPAFYMLSGFLQAFGKFCYIYGWKGISSLTGRRKFRNITDETYLKQDRNRAIKFMMLVTLSSILLTAIYYLLPF